MSFKLNEAGQLVDAEGKALEIDGKPIDVDLTGLKSQTEVDKVVQNRLAKANAEIKTLTEQKDKSPELERMLETAKDEKREKQYSERNGRPCEVKCPSTCERCPQPCPGTRRSLDHLRKKLPTAHTSVQRQHHSRERQRNMKPP